MNAPEEGIAAARAIIAQLAEEKGPRGNEFNGQVNWMQIDVGLDDHSRMIPPEQRLSLAMARQ